MKNKTRFGLLGAATTSSYLENPGLGAPCRAHGLPPPPRGDLERAQPLVPGGESKLWTISRLSLPGDSPLPQLSVVQASVPVHELGEVLNHLVNPEHFMLKIWPRDQFYLCLVSFLS